VIFGPLSQFFGEEFDFIEVVKTDLLEFVRSDLVVKMDHPVPAACLSFCSFFPSSYRFLVSPSPYHPISLSSFDQSKIDLSSFGIHAVHSNLHFIPDLKRLMSPLADETVPFLMVMIIVVMKACDPDQPFHKDFL